MELQALVSDFLEAVLKSLASQVERDMEYGDHEPELVAVHLYKGYDLATMLDEQTVNDAVATALLDSEELEQLDTLGRYVTRLTQVELMGNACG
jgi:hypothetical protein